MHISDNIVDGKDAIIGSTKGSNLMLGIRLRIYKRPNTKWQWCKWVQQIFDFDNNLKRWDGDESTGKHIEISEKSTKKYFLLYSEEFRSGESMLT